MSDALLALGLPSAPSVPQRFTTCCDRAQEHLAHILGKSISSREPEGSSLHINWQHQPSLLSNLWAASGKGGGWKLEKDPHPLLNRTML